MTSHIGCRWEDGSAEVSVERVRAYGLVSLRGEAGFPRSSFSAGSAAKASQVPVAAAVPVYRPDGSTAWPERQEPAGQAAVSILRPAVPFYPGMPARWSSALWDELREVLRQLEERDRLAQQPPVDPPPTAEPAPQPAGPVAVEPAPAPPPPAEPAPTAPPPVEPAPEPVAAPEPPPEPVANVPAEPRETYTVRPGDSLSAIAQRVLGDGNRWPEIYDLNREVIGANPGLIHPGQVLVLPGGASVPGPAPGPVPEPAPSPPPEPSPAPPPGPVSRREVPFISQYSPAGREGGYTNGNANCGPTSMAMVARAIGYGQDMTDARLINHLGEIGHTTSNGTGVNGIAVMARAMGLPAETRGPGPNVGWIVEQLRAGRFVVANGDYFAMKPHEDPGRTSGHYVLLTGIDDDGRILVRDPADSRVHSVSETELAHFIRSNPNGGYQIAVG